VTAHLREASPTSILHLPVSARLRWPPLPVKLSGEKYNASMKVLYLIKKAQEEYPGIVHCLRIEKTQDLNAGLASWLQEAYDHRKRKDQGEGDE
jgi:hypothetical protein